MTGWILLGFLGLGCGVSRPQVEDRAFALTTFQHAGGITTCLSCHTADRPLPINGFVHYNNEDCSQCHVPGGLWTQHSFPHAPTPVSCAQCHEKDRKAPVAGVTHGNGSDCVGCHTPATTWATGASFSHNPMPTACATCHESKRPAPVGGFAHYNNQDCVGCHTPTTWANYKLYPHSPVPVNCASCHENKRPASSTHPSINNAAVTDKSHFATKDCYLCHLPAAGANRVFSFSHSNAVGTNINFCLPCHYTQGKNKHGSANYFTGDGLCYNCHKTKRSWNAN